MAKSKARASRRAEAAKPAPQVETEQQKIARLALLRRARDLGLLPGPDSGVAPAPRCAATPLLRREAPPEDAGSLPRLALANVPVPERVRPPAPSRGDARAAEMARAWLQARPEASLAKRQAVEAAGVRKASVPLLLAATARALTPAEAAQLAAMLNA